MYLTFKLNGQSYQYQNHNQLIFILLAQIVFPNENQIDYLDLTTHFKKLRYSSIQCVHHKSNRQLPPFLHYISFPLLQSNNIDFYLNILTNIPSHLGLIRLKTTPTLLPKILQYMSKIGFKLTLKIDNIFFFLPKLGKSPYFIGQSIDNKYIIRKILKQDTTGRKSDVFLVMDSSDTPYIMKKYAITHKYNQEKSALLATYQWKHSPLLLEYDDNRLILIIEWCGIDLKHSKSKLDFKHQINKISKELLNNYGLYHNDIRWKNICLKSNNRLILIDWEKSKSKYIDTNDENILD